MMDIRAIRSDEDYAWAIEQIEPYFDTAPAVGTIDADRFDVLSALIKDYEDRTCPMPDADPVDVLNFAIESMGRSQTDLARIIGRSRASEVLSRQRRLTLDMIRDISAAWKIPIGALTAAYDIKALA